MLFSMTGYANGTVVLHSKKEEFAVEIELKTFNSRYFEASCKLPFSLSFLELKIVNLLQEKLIRGKVFLWVRFVEGNEVFESVIPSFKIIERYILAAKSIKKRFNLQGELTVPEVMRFSNVFVFQKGELNEKGQKEFFEGLSYLIDQLIKMRLKEGRRLQTDLEHRFDICAKKIIKIKKYFEIAITDQKKLIDEQLRLAQEGDEFAKKQSEELLISLNKMNVQEEITRFISHLKSVKDIFKNKMVQEKGKRLDFILQELLREINTLMAKCPNFNISSISVDVKVELEKIREQVQNIV